MTTGKDFGGKGFSSSLVCIFEKRHDDLKNREKIYFFCVLKWCVFAFEKDIPRALRKLFLTQHA